MKLSSSSWFRFLLVCAASLLVQTAFPMGEVCFRANYRGENYIIRKARSERPVVQLLNGKTVTPNLDTMGLFPVNGADAQTRPDWIYVDVEKANSSSLTFIGEGSSMNNELHLRFGLEAPVAYKNVFVVVYMSSEAGNGCMVREVGDMAAFSRETVAFDLRLNRALGRNHYFVYVFADGKELRHPMRVPDAFDARIAAEIRTRQASNESLLPTPYLTFAPRGVKKYRGTVLADMVINGVGRVQKVVIADGPSDVEAAKLVEAVKYWWFVPTRGKSDGEAFRISLDLSDLNQWSEKSVQVMPAAGPSN